ncbi:MAG: hypothetical protein GF411_20140 [Candidatus Lokiarchaeota archaeon]|nr:hypothetical protein [Candidatus Lokiarchaeota archaeon]
MTDILNKKRGLIFGIAVFIAAFSITMIFIPNMTYAFLISSGMIFVLIFYVFEFMITLSSRNGDGAISNAHIYAQHEKSPVIRRKPAEVLRTVRDPIHKEEIIIGGSRTMTYGEACRADWDFKSIRKKSAWILRDQHGNDITGLQLDDYDGIVTIELLEIRGHKSLDEEEEKARYMGVEFYD